MTLNDLMKLANRAYPDGYIARYWNFEKGKPIPSGRGDRLARAIVEELVETFDPEASEDEQRGVAAHLMLQASEDLQAVSHELEWGKLDEAPENPHRAP